MKQFEHNAIIHNGITYISVDAIELYRCTDCAFQASDKCYEVPQCDKDEIYVRKHDTE